MKFSLVVCTVDRWRELGSLLASLDAQWYRAFELIVVDQNADARVAPVLAPHLNHFPITHVRTTLRGAARARNLGMTRATGDVVCFPDDDCLYAPRVLEQVRTLLEANPSWGVVTGRTTEEADAPMTGGPVTPFNVWKRGIEYTMFFRRGVIDRIGPMDETLGVGAGTPWGAGEGTDYLLRALEAGFRVEYVPTLEVSHPRGEPTFEAHVDKSYRYAVGKGRVLQIRNCAPWIVAYHCVRPLVGAAASLLRGSVGEARVYWAVTKGICRGAAS